MAVFSAIIETFVKPVIDVQRDLTFGRTVRAQLVNDDPLWHKTMTLDRADQKPFCRLLISLGLKNFFQNDIMLIDSPPERK